MLTFNRIRKTLLRWNHVLTAGFFLLPFILLMGLGFLWLLQHSQLVTFFVFCLLISFIAWCFRYSILKKKRKPLGSGDIDEELEVQPNPEWSRREVEAFKAACTSIHQKTTELLPWQDLPQLSLEVVQGIAVQIGGDKKQPLDFSAPEALLLVEQTAKRYRQHLRSKLPFADQISISTLYWIWLKRKNISTAWKLADGGRRIARFASNPTGAIIKELEQLVAGGNINYFSEQMLSTLQAILLEEVASAAIDLYSGRLMFTDDELTKVPLTTTALDSQRLAEADDPLRVLVVGQVSAGKSTLLNQLLDQDKAETDIMATTDKMVTYSASVAGQPCHFVDTPGIDGTPQNRSHLLGEITNSDMLLWVMRADRPARSADLELLDALDEWEKANPLRRAPVTIFILSHMDRLVPEWPFAEHDIPDKVINKLEAVEKSVLPIVKNHSLISVSNAFPPWNIDRLCERLESHMVDALMVQRNRRRLQASKSSSVYKNTKQSVYGLYKSTKYVGSKWLTRRRTEKER